MGIDHLAVLERYGEAFGDAVDGNLERAVPSCPGWTVDDLVAHLAEVQGWWTSVVLAKGERPDADAARRAGETGPDRVAGWREITARYQAVQRFCSPDAVLWAWWGEEGKDRATAVAWRQAHELVVHCWDAQSAVGAPEPVPADLAADGVDEFIDHCLGDRARGLGPVVVELVAPDRSWLIGAPDGTGALRRLDAGGATVTVTVAGTAEQLYLLLWGRLAPEEVRVTGDREVLGRVLAGSETE
ncbi:maleylpyruvate isomerase family mycothiol-dependent enzyme [Actinosynnema sp. NPDC023587]|uniref:maleylpyruvate isomerase family mycothiol-dependent enzyme n=1 Tax=Actinosynnema sp. NPDC023587 TaxID=3154695 RepID=UPI0033DFCA0B